jgi:hypothetical protein
VPRILESEELGPEAVALLASLRRRSWKEIKNLRPEDTTTVRPKGGRIYIYHKHLSDERMLVVVQTYIPRWLGITSQVMADGFKIAPDGTITELRDEEFWDFT